MSDMLSKALVTLIQNLCIGLARYSGNLRRSHR
jgi:hypothetical protein